MAEIILNSRGSTCNRFMHNMASLKPPTGLPVRMLHTFLTLFMKSCCFLKNKLSFVNLNLIFPTMGMGYGVIFLIDTLQVFFCHRVATFIKALKV